MYSPFNRDYEHHGQLTDPNTIVPPNILGNRHINPHYLHLSSNLSEIAPKVLLIDSADRISGTSEKFIVKLEYPIRRIRSLEVLQINIPGTEYVIHEHNRYLTFRESSDINNFLTIEVPLGDYDIQDLLNIIGNLMTSASQVGNSYQLTLNVSSQQVTITNANQSGLGILEIPWERSPGMARLLGFDATSTSIGALNYTGSYRYNLMPYDYLAVHVTGLAQGSHQLVVSPNQYVDNAMFIVWFRDKKAEIRGTKDVNLRYVKYYNPPIDLDTVRVEFRTPQGHLYNFRGRQVQILFKVDLTYNYQKITRNEQL